MYLLGNKAGNSHAGCRIDFEQIRRAVYDDIIGPDNSFAAYTVIDAGSKFLYLAGQSIGNTSRSNLLDPRCRVFGFIIEKFILLITSVTGNAVIPDCVL